MAACYDCLMSYSNQPDHQVLDRLLIRDSLLAFAAGKVDASPARCPMTSTGPGWTGCATRTSSGVPGPLDHGGYRLPDEAGMLIAEASTKPDFLYTDQVLPSTSTADPTSTRIGSSGTAHSSPHWRTWAGLCCASAADDWPALLAAHPVTFGTGR